MCTWTRMILSLSLLEPPVFRDNLCQSHVALHLPTKTLSLKESQLEIKVKMFFFSVMHFQPKTINFCHLQELVSPECWSSRAKDCSWVPYQVNHLQVVPMSLLWSLVPPPKFWKSSIWVPYQVNCCYAIIVSVTCYIFQCFLRACMSLFWIQGSRFSR